MLKKLLEKIKKANLKLPLIRRKALLIIIGLIVIVVLAGRGLLGSRAKEVTQNVSKITSGGFDLSDKPTTIDPSKLRQGCPFKDCIPSIDNPKFLSKEEGDKYLSDEDVIFGVNLNEDVRAYPQRILNWHEIVNDKVGGKAVVVSFCPLCGTAIAHERMLKGQEVEFGVSGKLLQSNLVMYDRFTETLWVHALGEAVAGELAGQKLTQVPLETTTWGSWKQAHPKTKVLSTDTGFSRSYDSYPYGDYESSGRFLFEPDVQDDRLHPKAIGYGIEIGGLTKFYPDDGIVVKSFVDNFASRKLEIKRTGAGSIKITDLGTDENINYTRSMWFSWAAFHPKTELYK